MEHALETVSRLVGVGLIRLEPEGTVLELTTLAREELGPGVEPHRKPRPGLAREIRRSAARGAPVRVRLGEREIEIEARAEPGGRSFLATVRSVEQVERVGRGTESALQMNAVARLYRDLAHDLKGPLQSMVLELDLLREKLERDRELAEPQASHLEALSRELVRHTRALQTLLSSTRAAPATIRSFDLRRVTRDVESLVAIMAGPRRQVAVFRRPREAVRVTANRERIKRALLSVCTNSLEAMGPGGRLEVELSRSPHRARILVRDTGHGIPAEIVHHVFDLHFTTRADGSGIGLHVARRILRDHGGDVTLVRSSPEGTEFLLKLPLEAAR